MTPVRSIARMVGVAAVAMATIATCTPLPPPPTSDTVPPVAGDATAAIQRVLDERGSVTIDRELVANGTITPPAGSTMRFTPTGLLRRTATPTARSTPIIRLAADRVTVTSPRIVGPNPCYWSYFDTGYRYSRYDPATEAQHGIDIVGGTGHRITNARIADVWGDGVYLGGNRPTDVTISGLDVDCVGRSGVSNTNSARVTITGATVDGAFWWGFNIEPFGSRSVEDYTVKGATIGFARDAPIFAGGPDFNCQVRRVAFNDTTFAVPIRDTPSIAGCVAAQVTVK